MTIASEHPAFQPPSPAIEARIEALLAQLSLAERIDFLSGQSVPGNTLPCPRLGIPHLLFSDGPLGVHWHTRASTAYPATLLLAASWDAGLARAYGDALGRDCRARGIHVILAPGVNLYRSSACGRNFEYYGEDPLLAGRMAAAAVRGIQARGVSAAVKHFVANNSEYDRHHTSSSVDERTLREVYLLPFELAVRSGGAGMVICGYNLLNGQHCCENPWLLRTVLKEGWGFDGVVMSDWVGTYDGVAAANAGLDLEQPAAVQMTRTHLLAAVERGLVTPATIADKVRRLLRVQACFGWLDHPASQCDAAIPQSDPVADAVAIRIAAEGAVLLRNDGVLPFVPSGLRRLAVIGAHAHPAVISGGGSAAATPHAATSLVDGLRRRLPGVEIIHHPGVPLDHHEEAYQHTVWLGADGQPGLEARYGAGDTAPAVPGTRPQRAVADWSHDGEVAPGVRGDDFGYRWSGRIVPALDGRHRLYLQSYGAARILVDGVEVLGKAAGDEPEFLRIAELDVRAGHPLAVEIIGRHRGAWPCLRVGLGPVVASHPGIAAAAALAADCDAVVVTAGFSPHTETEGHDRPFGLGAWQDELLRQVAAANPRHAVVLFSGGALDAEPWIDAVRAVLWAGYPGQGGGTALAALLCGDAAPAGRLPFSWEREPAHRSSHGSYIWNRPEHRVAYQDGVHIGYRHHLATGVAPRFAFGHGLAYTTFSWSDLHLSAAVLAPGETLVVRARVRNAGAVAGSEVVQLYLSDPQASGPRPLRELKAFAKVYLQPGEQAEVELSLAARDLAFWDADAGCWRAEAGTFGVVLASDAQTPRLEDTFRLLADWTAPA